MLCAASFHYPYQPKQQNRLTIAFCRVAEMILHYLIFFSEATLRYLSATPDVQYLKLNAQGVESHFFPQAVFFTKIVFLK